MEFYPAQAKLVLRTVCKCILHPKVSTNFRLQSGVGVGVGEGMSKEQIERPNDINTVLQTT